MVIITKIEKDVINNEEVEFLQLYDEDGNILAKSDNNKPGTQHEVTFDDITFVADTTGRILVDYESLFIKFHKTIQ